MRLITLLLLIAVCLPCVAQVTLLGSSATGAGGAAQSGIYTMLGSAGQTGPPGASATGVYAFNGGFLTWPGYGAMTLQHTAVASAAAGSGINISASLQGGSPLSTMTLLYRQGGELTFSSLPMTISVSAGQATIPGSAVTARGVEYIIRANDPAGGTTSRMPVTGYYSVQVLMSDPGVQIPSALPAEKYRLVSLPLVADNPAAGNLLVKAFGAYDNTKWRFYELLANQNYSEYPTVASMVPGKAFWLITKSGGTFSTGSARSNVTNGTFSVDLNPGWTFVGNPYNFNVPISKLSKASATTVDIRRWADAWQVETVGLSPFSGYAVANTSTTVDRLIINPDLSTGGLPRPAESGEKVLAAWRIGITAQSGEAVDADNEVIASAAASKTLDDLDRPEAPTIGDYVSLYFGHPEWDAVFSRYCTDARPVPVEGETWGFEVSTGVRGKVDLRFSGLESVPTTFDVWVVDLDLRTPANLRTSAGYQFVGNGEGNSRRFSLVVGSAAYAQERLTSAGVIPQQYELQQNYPNPFNPLTVIRYGLPSPAHVSLEVYDLLGRRVTTLVDENQEVGFRNIEFDGKGIASGVYLYRYTAVPLSGGQRFSQVRKMVLAK